MSDESFERESRHQSGNCEHYELLEHDDINNEIKRSQKMNQKCVSNENRSKRFSSTRVYMQSMSALYERHDDDASAFQQ